MGDETKSDGFDISLSALPPKLQLQLWTLSLDANTSRVQLAYKPGAFIPRLTYNYGGALEASWAVRRLTPSVGVNPSDGNVDLGLVYRGYNFRVSTNLSQPSVGFGLSYGTRLLPFPNEMGCIFSEADRGLRDTAGAFVNNNPLGLYQIQSDDITAISTAISLGKRIYDVQTSPYPYNFGAGVRVHYDREMGLTISGGVQFSFW